MVTKHMASFHHFIVIGISYKKTDSYTRSQFQLSADAICDLYQKAALFGNAGLLVLSTCNRTELYAYNISAEWLLEQWQHIVPNNGTVLNENIYHYAGKVACSHLLRVASGLDSQILGDKEIVDQVKQALSLSKSFNATNVFMERLVNIALQCSKRIKNETPLSDGTTSVAYAIVKYLKNNAPNNATKLLLLGFGSFGKSIAKNILTYIPHLDLSICNRTLDKVEDFSQHNSITPIPWEQRYQAVNDADIVIGAIGGGYQLNTDNIKTCKQRLFLDASIPSIIDKGLNKLVGQYVVDVDIISNILTESLQTRVTAVPKAIAIVEATIQDFERWLSEYEQMKCIRTFKKYVLSMSSKNAVGSYLFKSQIDSNINQITSKLALKIKNAPAYKGCHLLHAINEVIIF
jgi:glutamyl-tRNA reductase